MNSVLDTFSLKGKTVLITGGGGGPLGRQMTEALAEAGANALLTSRNTDSLEAFCKSLSDRGYHADILTLDQSDPGSINALRDHVLSEYTKIDVLVNNAVLRPMGDWDSEPESFAQSMSINATGLFAITQAFAGHMADHGGGSIINVGSIQGMVGPDFSLYEGLGWKIAPDYFFHKSGMLNFSRYVASKFGPQGVRCNTLSPGGCFNDQDPRFVERYNRRTMLGRMANETDLKGAVVFLASDASAYITASNIVVDGGYTAHSRNHDMSALVPNPDSIRLAMLGMVEGNGHPYSWSAIINGRYDAKTIADCGYPVIGQYLGAQPAENLGIPGTEVTHVWCDNPTHSVDVAKAAYIPNVADKPEDVIGHVDAVLIATDIGHEHVERARPFIEAGIPTFIDKPLTDSREGLAQFTAWQKAGRPYQSSSCMRYAAEFLDLKNRLGEIGEPRIFTVLMCKSWERYGIHALEAVYSMLPAGGYEWVRNTGDETSNIVHIRHRESIDVILVTVADLYGSFGIVQAGGTKRTLQASMNDTFNAFKTQLESFVNYLRTGADAIPFEHLREQMAIIIAGTESRSRGGECIYLKDVLNECAASA